MWRRYLSRTLVATAVAAVALPAYSVNGLSVEPPRDVVPTVLIDHDGRAARLPLASGTWQLVAFGYTHCPDVCPMTLHRVAMLLQRLGPKADKVRGVFVSIDGQRDDTARMKEFVARFDTRLVGLTGSPEATVAAANAFGVLTRRFQGKTALAYTLSHSSLLYLVDPQGRLRYVYSEQATPAQIAQDLESLAG